MAVDQQFLDEVAAAVRNPGRLETVRRTGLFDTAPEGSFDVRTGAAASLLGTDHAFVTIVGERRSFWKSCRGVEVGSDRRMLRGIEFRAESLEMRATREADDANGVWSSILSLPGGSVSI